MFSLCGYHYVQWENPVCDETIAPACVAIVPGFPGCLEVVVINHDFDSNDDGFLESLKAVP